MVEMRAEKLLQGRQKCSVGCAVLDRCLGGGVPCDSVTEFVGESGVGKTQLCLQLAISVQLPPSHGGLSASSIFIHTEFPFPFRRLRHLSGLFRASHPDLPDPCDRLFLRPVHSAHELLALIPIMETFLLHSRSPVRIILIDSIAALFRSDFENNASDLRRRSSLFFGISSGLRRLANRFSLAVVVTNQVVDGGIGNGNGNVRVGNLGNGLYSSGRHVCPALGLAWAHCVNSRLFLSRDHNENRSRRMTVVFAPHLPHSSCEYVINGEGVFGT